MRIKRLQLVNLRAFEQAEFEFMPGMNLLVGVNGVGKTTVLDSLRICLSKIIFDITKSRGRKIPFVDEDIRVKSDFMTVNCTFEIKDMYLFSWDDVPGNDIDRFIKYLIKNFGIDWATKVKTEKIDDGKTINVYTEKKSLSLRLNDEKTKVNLTINDDKIFELNASMENSKLKIYQDNDFTFLVHKNRESYVPLSSKLRKQIMETPDINRRGRKKKVQRPKLVLETPDKESYHPSLPDSFDNPIKGSSEPFVLFFSTRRALVSDAIVDKKKAAKDNAGAYAEGLVSRELRLAEIAEWMHAQKKLGDELPLRLKHLYALQKAAEHFMPDCKNLRAKMSPKPRLIVDKAGTTLDMRQLSDGERGMFALVLDLAKRLSQANPQLDDPVKVGSAIVLIDEIDLHLHPKWQRTVVKKLTETFPNCQFIATTHSPQIIASVEPEQVLLLTNSGVILPERTRGMDSNWILRHLMEADDRPAESSSAINKVESLIIDSNFKDAREAITKYRKNGLDLPEWSVLEARMARMELLAE